MSIAIQGLAVSRGIAIGKAVLMTSVRSHVQHYYIQASQVEDEIKRVGAARNKVVQELEKLLADMPADAPHELAAILDVHLMLLQDQELVKSIKQWIEERHYNAEWALTRQLEIVSRQFDEMEDPYLRERKADLEQVVERILQYMQNDKQQAPASLDALAQQSQIDSDAQLILVAHDLSPADMLKFKASVFVGFITDVGGPTSHTAIVARSMDIPAVVGARTASQLLRPDDLVIIDGDAGLVLVDPEPSVVEEYRLKQRQSRLERERLVRIKHTPAITLDGERVDLLANIEMPSDAALAVAAGAVGVGLFRSEFLFMGRAGDLPDEEEQYLAYREAVQGMRGLPLTIRTIDIGSDKPLDRADGHGRHEHEPETNPALGLRAIRWCLAEPAMFRAQICALLRAAAHGSVKILIPMLCAEDEIAQTLAHIAACKEILDARGESYGPVQIGAMIEIPAAALQAEMFLDYFDFLSIGTNDLIQYTLAIDRSDDSVAHLYNPLHPAVLFLIEQTIQAARKRGKLVTVCGEMAGDARYTQLLLRMGLRSFSMHPAQILQVKQQVLQSHAKAPQELAA